MSGCVFYLDLKTKKDNLFSSDLQIISQQPEKRPVAAPPRERVKESARPAERCRADTD